MEWGCLFFSPWLRSLCKLRLNFKLFLIQLNTLYYLFQHGFQLQLPCADRFWGGKPQNSTFHLDPFRDAGRGAPGHIPCTRNPTRGFYFLFSQVSAVTLRVRETQQPQDLTAWSRIISQFSQFCCCINVYVINNA